MALSRVAARVVESGPDGEDLAVGTWQRLEALPDPRSPRGVSIRWPAWWLRRPARRPEGETLVPSRLRAVAVDGKISRGARRADGTRVHLLGVAEHGRASRQTVYAVTSLTSAHATAQDLGRLVREHWSIEAHHIHRNTPGSLKILQTCKNCSNYVR